MSMRLLVEGNKIDFRQILSKSQVSEGMKPQTYASQILDIYDDNMILVSMPMHHGRIVPFTKGEKYEAFFYTLKGLYNCKIEVVERYKSNNMYTMKIALEGSLSKYQRRQYYRLGKTIEIKYTELDSERYDIIINKRRFPESLSNIGLYTTGNTLDISGGGLRFTGTRHIKTGEKMLVIFEIYSGGEYFKFRLPATVIMSFELENHPGMYEHRICFDNISKVYREILIKYIFEEERKMRRNSR